MIRTNLPTTIKALEYSEMCGERHIRDGIVMMDDFGNPICRMTNGTIREKKIALLWQASLQLLELAKTACEEERAFYDKDDTRTAPSWLTELEAVVKNVEHGDFSVIKTNLH